jgi:hypothetical protein
MTVFGVLVVEYRPIADSRYYQPIEYPQDLKEYRHGTISFDWTSNIAQVLLPRGGCPNLLVPFRCQLDFRK